MTTIAAIATHVGYAGIGVVKVSGPDALRVAVSMFRPSRRNKFSCRKVTEQELADRRANYGFIVDPRTSKPIDEVICLVMRKPHSYTGEDIVEFQSHSGPLILSMILDAVLSLGVRQAQPGEFTRRAFMNGKIDLTRAEAVMDLIEARSRDAVQLALEQLSGGLEKKVLDMIGAIESVLSEIEAVIDFPEAAGEVIDAIRFVQVLNDVLFELNDLLDRADTYSYIRNGFNVILAGRVNTGKSSLLNRLVEKERAIVTDIPGTTRDFIESEIIFQGLPLVLIDTAGLRDDPEFIEAKGIEKTRSLLSSADLVLFITELHRPFTPGESRWLSEIPKQKVILVRNKADLIHGKEPPGIPPEYASLPVIEISAKYGTRVNELKEMIVSILNKKRDSEEISVLPNPRHGQLLFCSKECLERAVNGLSGNEAEELIVVDLREAIGYLGEIIGQNIQLDHLDLIFQRFCIGK